MEKRKHYPPKVLAHLQDIELEILRVLDRLCRDNDIEYFLMGGNLLGAVRHGGFIPWDDDMDVGMAYEEYLKFLEIAPTALPQGYSLHNCENTERFFCLWSKIFVDGTRFIDENAQEAGLEQGIFLDVIPFHRLAADKKVAWKQCHRGYFWQRMSYLHHLSRPKVPQSTRFRSLKVFACKIIHYTVAQLFSTDKIYANWISSYETHGKPGRLWMNMTDTYHELLDQDELFPTQDIDYAGVTVLAPHDIDAILTSDFGEYMALPPEDQRYTHLPLILDFGDGINVMEEDA